MWSAGVLSNWFPYLFDMISLFSYFLAQNILNLETANCPRIFQYKSILEVTVKTPRVSSLLHYRWFQAFSVDRARKYIYFNITSSYWYFHSNLTFQSFYFISLILYMCLFSLTLKMLFPANLNILFLFHSTTSTKIVSK